MKKKILTALVLAGALCVFAACGETEADVRGEIVSSVEDADVDEEPQVEEETEEEEEVAVETEAEVDDTEVEEEAEAEAEEEVADIELGNVEENVYENVFIGIGCKLGSDWTFKTNEEMRAINNISAELMGDEYKEALEKANVIQDMMVAKNDNTKNINVVIQKIEGLASIASERDLVEAAGIDTMLKDALANMGFIVDYTNIVDETIAGQKHVAVDIEGTLNGMALNEKMIVIKKGTYMVCITFAQQGDSDFSELIDSFYALD